MEELPFSLAKVAYTKSPEGTKRTNRGRQSVWIWISPLFLLFTPCPFHPTASFFSVESRCDGVCLDPTETIERRKEKDERGGVE